MPPRRGNANAKADVDNAKADVDKLAGEGEAGFPWQPPPRPIGHAENTDTQKTDTQKTDTKADTQKTRRRKKNVRSHLGSSQFASSHLPLPRAMCGFLSEIIL